MIGLWWSHRAYRKFTGCNLAEDVCDFGSPKSYINRHTMTTADLIRALIYRYMRRHGKKTFREYNELVSELCDRYSASPHSSFRALTVLFNSPYAERFEKKMPQFDFNNGFCVGVRPRNFSRFFRAQERLQKYKEKKADIRKQNPEMCQSCKKYGTTKSIKFRSIKLIDPQERCDFYRHQKCGSCWNKAKALAKRINESYEIKMLLTKIKKEISNVRSNECQH